MRRVNKEVPCRGTVSRTLRHKVKSPEFLTVGADGQQEESSARPPAARAPARKPPVDKKEDNAAPCTAAKKRPPPENPLSLSRPRRKRQWSRRSKKKLGAECVVELGENSYWEIETIMDKRVRKGRVEYLIGWKNCPDTMNSWEPCQNLCDTAFSDAQRFSRGKTRREEQLKEEKRCLEVQKETPTRKQEEQSTLDTKLTPRKKRAECHAAESSCGYDSPWKWTDEEQVKFQDVERINVNCANARKRVTDARVYGVPVVLVGAIGWANFAKRWLKTPEGRHYDDDEELDLDLSKPHEVDTTRMIEDVGSESVPVVKKDYDEENPIDRNIPAEEFLKLCWPPAAVSRTSTPTGRLYLHQWQFPLSDKAGRKLCHKNMPLPGNIFGDDLLKYWKDLSSCQEDSPFQYIFMGREGTASKLHRDLGGLAITIAPIVGEKECVLVHRADGASCLYHLNADLEKIDLQSHPLIGNARVWRCTVSPGEILLMPQGTYHQCRNTSPCLSYSRFHLDTVNLVAFLHSMLDGDAPEIDHEEVLWNATFELVRKVDRYVDHIRETVGTLSPSLPPLEDGMVETIDTVRSLRNVCREIARRRWETHRNKDGGKGRGSDANVWDKIVDDVDLCLHEFRHRGAVNAPSFSPRLGLRTRARMPLSTTDENAAASREAVRSDSMVEPPTHLVAYGLGDRGAAVCIGSNVVVRFRNKKIKGEVLRVEHDMHAAYLSYEDYPELCSEYVPFSKLRRPLSGELSSEVRAGDVKPGLVVLNRCGAPSEEYRAVVKATTCGTFYKITGDRYNEFWVKREAIVKVLGSPPPATADAGQPVHLDGTVVSETSREVTSAASSNSGTHAPAVSSDASSSVSLAATVSRAGSQRWSHPWHAPDNSYASSEEGSDPFCSLRITVPLARKAGTSGSPVRPDSRRTLISKGHAEPTGSPDCIDLTLVDDYGDCDSASEPVLRVI